MGWLLLIGLLALPFVGFALIAAPWFVGSYLFELAEDHRQVAIPLRLAGVLLPIAMWVGLAAIGIGLGPDAFHHAGCPPNTC